jgi:heme-degrading monooxygenase HmoA
VLQSDTKKLRPKRRPPLFGAVERGVRFKNTRREMMDTVTVINPFEVPQGREDETLSMWEAFAEYFRKQPGYISTKLHKAIVPDAKFHFINIAEWESADAFQTALNNPELMEVAKNLPDDIPHYPGLYEVIRT